MAVFPNNQYHNQIWLRSTEIAVQTQPSDAAFYVHEGVKGLVSGQFGTFQQRSNIFENFSRAARTGYPRGFLFESFCWQYGFGRDADPATGNALFRVAAIARECDLAVSFLLWCLGSSYLYGKNDLPQNYRKAIDYLLKAGQLALPEIKLITEHFKTQEKRRELSQAQQSKFRQFPAVSYRPRMICTS